MKSKFELLSFLLLILFALSCTKEEKDDPPQVQSIPTLLSFSPTSGHKNTLVTIIGTNFGDIANAQVFFNNVEAELQSVSATQIIALVPTAANTGVVKVISNGTELIGQEFSYILSIEVSTLAGQSFAGNTDGVGIDAKFNNS